LLSKIIIFGTKNNIKIRELYAMLKKPTAQIAHFFFAETQANAEKPKELFFSQRSTEIETELNE